MSAVLLSNFFPIFEIAFPSESNLYSKRICLSFLILDPLMWLICSNYPNVEASFMIQLCWNSLMVLNVCHFLSSKSFLTKKTEQNLLLLCYLWLLKLWKNHFALCLCNVQCSYFYSAFMSKLSIKLQFYNSYQFKCFESQAFLRFSPRCS